MKTISFSTKAETLKQIEGKLTCGTVLSQYQFTHDDYQKRQQEVIMEILVAQNTWGSENVIVRSSALSEDSTTQSKAGQYCSILNVNGKEGLESAIDRVFASYDIPDSLNQVLVQPMLQQIQSSGVMFTVDPQNASPYLVINYDDNSGSTDSVTSGTGKSLKTCYHLRGRASQSPFISRCQEVAEELMDLFGHPYLDIEFAVSNQQFYVFQVRPLIVSQTPPDLQKHETALQEIHDYLVKAMGKHPYLYGDTTIFGVMPDWNPAEIIGLRPKQLSLSLYKYLVTDSVWAYQRDNYGYKNLRSFPLMIDFSGLPYVDTRISFNSFIPKNIDHTLSDKLANYYLRKLKEQPDQQDKVEFEIILSCFTFDLDCRLKTLEENGFTKEECQQLKGALLDLTNRVSNTEEGLWKKDMARIEQLELRLNRIPNSDLSITDKIYWLLEDCSRYGTLPFAGLARIGFISVLLLKSMVTVGLLSPEDYDRFMNSLHTVSSEMSQDYQDLSQRKFLEKYGHLRPGTYDITSPRYDQAPELYFPEKKGIQSQEPSSAQEEFRLSLGQYERIQQVMLDQGLKLDVLSLFQFIKSGIEHREYSKFVFTKSLSLVLELVAELGEEYGFTREDMACFDIQQIKLNYSKTGNLKEVIAQAIEKGRAQQQTALHITLPPVIVSPEDLYSFHMSEVTPNYITQKKITAPVIMRDLSQNNIKGKILLIPSADPGFDWIFAQEIAGFVTAFGGVNSHMAIRSNELGIPAVIGVGEQKFSQLSSVSVLKIDCEGKKMEVLS